MFSPAYKGRKQPQVVLCDSLTSCFLICLDVFLFLIDTIKFWIELFFGGLGSFHQKHPSLFTLFSVLRSLSDSKSFHFNYVSPTHLSCNLFAGAMTEQGPCLE